MPFSYWFYFSFLTNDIILLTVISPKVRNSLSLLKPELNESSAGEIQTFSEDIEKQI